MMSAGKSKLAKPRTSPDRLSRIRSPRGHPCRASPYPSAAMAANFWTSSHHKNWLRNSDAIVVAAKQTVQRDQALLTEEEVVRAKILHCRVISELAVKSGLRQRVAATATVYFKRFYVRHGLKDHDPRLIAPVALYLAAKVEEHTLPAKVIIANMTSLYPSQADHAFPYAVSHVYDYEFKLIAALDFDLIIFHPYRPIVQYCTNAQLTDLLATAWPILNDSYLTDVCLLYPPFLVAIACIYLAGTLADRDMRPWVTSLSVSTQDIGDLAQHLANMYASPLLALPSAGSTVDDALINKLHSHFKSGLSTTGAPGTSGFSSAAGAATLSAPPPHTLPGAKRPPSGSRRQ
jgi:cyclin-C